MQQHRTDAAALLLRLALGTVLLTHSLYLKLFIFTLPGTAQFFVSLGLPGILAYIVFGIEVIAGISMLLGIGSRYAALVVIPVLLGATWAHSGAGWLFSNPNGGWEYPLFLTITALVVSLLGDGVYTIKHVFISNRITTA